MKAAEIFKASRFLSVTLVISIALNLLLAGFIAGRNMGFHPPPRPMPSNLAWLMRESPEPTKEKIRTLLTETRKENQGLRSELFKAQKNFYELLGKENLTEEELINSLTRLREKTSVFQASMHKQMARILVDLPLEERTNLLNNLERRKRDHGFPPP